VVRCAQRQNGSRLLQPSDDESQLGLCPVTATAIIAGAEMLAVLAIMLGILLR
jgi:hypothetical protein